MGIFDAFTTKNADKAAVLQTAALDKGKDIGSAYLNKGLEYGTNSLTAGLQPFLTNYTTANQGQQAYADFAGANGTEGNTRALQNFQAGPGYQFALNQGNENILRNQSRTGQLASGGTNIDLLNYGQGMANQRWDQYGQNLMPFLQQSNAAAGGIGGMYSNLANLQSGIFGKQSELGYSTEVQKGAAAANAALAGNNASANLLNFGQSIAGLGSNTLGSKAGSSAMSGLGDIATTLGSFIFSDEDLKTDIEPVGKLYDGQEIYRYKYVDDPNTTHIGLIAQQVEDVEPDAVADIAGFKAVDYRRATEFASKLAEFV